MRLLEEGKYKYFASHFITIILYIDFFLLFVVLCGFAI